MLIIMFFRREKRQVRHRLLLISSIPVTNNSQKVLVVGGWESVLSRSCLQRVQLTSGRGNAWERDFRVSAHARCPRGRCSWVTCLSPIINYSTICNYSQWTNLGTTHQTPSLPRGPLHYMYSHNLGLVLHALLSKILVHACPLSKILDPAMPCPAMRSTGGKPKCSVPRVGRVRIMKVHIPTILQSANVNMM